MAERLNSLPKGGGSEMGVSSNASETPCAPLSSSVDAFNSGTVHQPTSSLAINPRSGSSGGITHSSSVPNPCPSPGPGSIPVSSNQQPSFKIGHYVLGETLGVGTFGKVKS